MARPKLTEPRFRLWRRAGWYYIIFRRGSLVAPHTPTHFGFCHINPTGMTATRDSADPKCHTEGAKGAESGRK